MLLRHLVNFSMPCFLRRLGTGLIYKHSVPGVKKVKKYGSPQIPLESCFELLHKFSVTHLLLTHREQETNWQDSCQKLFPGCSGKWSNGVIPTFAPHGSLHCRWTPFLFALGQVASLPPPDLQLIP